MEAPATLNGYFTIVDDFFRKTFRDDCHFFMALKSRQYSESILGVNMFDKDAAAASSAIEESPNRKPAMRAPVSGGISPASTDASDAAAVNVPSTINSVSSSSPGHMSNFLSISPRMLLRRDGTALGKVKVAYAFDVPRVCRLEQALILNNRGAVTAVGKVKELMEGLTAGVRVCVNTIAPASEDVTSGHLHYQRGDKYSSLEYQRNGLGSSDLLVDCGITFFNLLLGAGFEHRQLSFLEQQEGPTQLDVMYAGAGFTGVNWSLAAKLIRANDAWSTAQVALLQRLSPHTAVACQYNFDLAESLAKVSLGFTQGIQLRLPTLIQTRGVVGGHGAAAGAAPAAGLSWSAPVSLVVATKAESDGNAAVTLRGLFSQSIRWGVVAQKNLLDVAAKTRFGLTLSIEYES